MAVLPGENVGNGFAVMGKAPMLLQKEKERLVVIKQSSMFQQIGKN
ncbi:hypothetical protein QA612_17380 [Evansella sp. AB-P1]|nr:hypothetical protein [Evansella sp. AB-P1]MDG5789234.1 hypothetical protein [Evansella sp. AB-P1]